MSTRYVYEKELVSCGHWPRERAANVAVAAKRKCSLQMLTKCSEKGKQTKKKIKKKTVGREIGKKGDAL